MERLPDKPGKVWTGTHDTSPAPTKAVRYSLSELSKHYHFFSHGALFSFGGLAYPHEDPLVDWYALQTPGTPIIKETFQRPIFDGLLTTADNVSWNNILCGVRHDDWQSLWTFLCGTAIVDRKNHLYREVFSGDVELQDPSLIARYGVLQTPLSQITVTVFCVDGNDARYEVRTPGIVDTAGFYALPPRQEVRARASMALTGNYSELSSKDNQAIKSLVNVVSEGKYGSSITTP
jgi:hypothetical protein